MLTAKESEMEKRREKARNLRYKKPMLKELNLENIQAQLSEMMEACGEAAYYIQNDDDDMLYNALDGDDSDVEEFKMQFRMLSNELEQLYDDMGDTFNYALEERDFDLFFVGIGGRDSTGDIMLGYDEYEGDYFGLEGSFESEAAEREAEKKLQRLTKEELIRRAQLCFRIAFNFYALRHRYEDLEAALEILRAENRGLVAQIKAIEKAYAAAEAVSFDTWYKEAREFEELTRDLPERVWIE